MAKSYRLDSGMLFDKRWETSLRALPAKKFRKLFWELYDFQESRGEKKVPDYAGDSYLQGVVSLIVPQIQNRIDGARKSTPGGTPPPTPGGTPPPPPLKLSEDELRKDKLSLVDLSVSEAEGDAAVAASETAHTHAKEKMQEKKAYGCHGNVYLTEGEYRDLVENKGIPVTYIDHFSNQLFKGRYHIADHGRAIALWWEDDRHKSKSAPAGGKAAAGMGPRPDGTFNTDDFFEAAVRKSLGDV